MESTVIRLCYCPLPSAPLLRLSNGAKGRADAWSSKFHHTFNHASLRASQFPTLHPIATRSFCHANCMADRLFSVPSNNNEESDNNTVLRGMTGISLVLACVLGLFNFNSKMNPMFKAAHASPFPGLGGKYALESLLNTINAQEPSKSNRAPPLYRRPDLKKDGVTALKLYAVRLSKSGSKDLALQTLESECNNPNNDSERFNLEIALVELLILQGKYKQARERLEVRIDEFLRDKDIDPKQSKDKINKLLEIYDDPQVVPFEFDRAQIAQLLLYKAVVHSMLGDDEAAKLWEAFGSTL